MNPTSLGSSLNLTRPVADSSQQSVPRFLVLMGRILLAAIFVISSSGHFMPQTVNYAAHQGVPFAEVLVPASGLMALIGGLSVLAGYRARVGALLLVIFLVPVTLTMHAFWAVHDPQMAMMQLSMFFKNLGLMGGALLILYYGAGPLSLDRRQGR